MTDPVVPLTRALSIGALLEQAAKDLPVLAEDGISVSVTLDERGASVAGTVTVKDFTGRIVAAQTWTGQKELNATVTWRF